MRRAGTRLHRAAPNNRLEGIDPAQSAARFRQCSPQAPENIDPDCQRAFHGQRPEQAPQAAADRGRRITTDCDRRRKRNQYRLQGRFAGAILTRFACARDAHAVHAPRLGGFPGRFRFLLRGGAHVFSASPLPSASRCWDRPFHIFHGVGFLVKFPQPCGALFASRPCCSFTCMILFPAIRCGMPTAVRSRSKAKGNSLSS